MSTIMQLSWASPNATMSSIFPNFRLQSAFCDVTVCCRGNYFPAHRLILSAFSDYFKEILEKMPCKHPFILVQNADGEDLKALLDFLYIGEVSVNSVKIESFLNLAQNLEIRGFASGIKPREPLDNDSSSTSSEFCINMSQLGEKIQEPIVDEEPHEFPEPIKKMLIRRTKRKRKESSPLPPSPSPKKDVISEGEEDSQTKKKKKKTSISKVKEDPKPKRKKTSLSKEEEDPQPSNMVYTKKETTPPPTKLVEPEAEEKPLKKDEIIEDNESTDDDPYKSDGRKAMVLIENCPALDELTRNFNDKKISVKIPPSENVITNGDSDDDFFDDDFPSESHVPDSDSRVFEDFSFSSDDQKQKSKSDTPPRPAPASKKRKSVLSKARKIKSERIAKRKTEKEEKDGLFPKPEHLKVAIKDDGYMGTQTEENTSATTSNLSHTPEAKIPKAKTEKGDSVAPSEEPLTKDEEPKTSPEEENGLADEDNLAGTSKDPTIETLDKKTSKKHRSKKKSFFCHFCPYKTAISVNLRVHLRTHTGEKPYKCSFCPYKSTQKSALSTHMQRHSEKKLNCRYCSFETRYGSKELLEHEKTHTDTTSYQCSRCTFITNRFQNLQRHEYKHHVKVENDDSNEKFEKPKKVSKKKKKSSKSRKHSLLKKKKIAIKKEKEETEANNASENDGSINTAEKNSLEDEGMTSDEMPLIFSSKIQSPFKGFINDDTPKTPESPTVSSVDTCDTEKTRVITTTTTTTSSEVVTPVTSISVRSVSVISPPVSSLNHLSPIDNPDTLRTPSPLPTDDNEFILPDSSPPVENTQFLSSHDDNQHSPIDSPKAMESVVEDEPFTLPKVTNIYGRVPFSMPTTPTITVHDDPDDDYSSRNYNIPSCIPSPNTSVDSNRELLSVHQSHCEDPIENTHLENLQYDVPALTISSVSSGVVFDDDGSNFVDVSED